jgi:hypothetical protein
MQTFEIEVLDMEIAHYATTYKVEAENEEEAKRLVLSGKIDSLDCETYDHSDFCLEVAKRYVNGESQFRTISHCKVTKSDAELESEKVQKEINDLKGKLKIQKNKLALIKNS